ncbi:MAG: Hsp70 family protein [Planctomycetes bacterium]|nr:Hsp70 family protein [Planctomycetota bacterium]
MKRYVGIDFGTSSTVVSVVEDDGEPQIVMFPRYSQEVRDSTEPTHAVPSLIHFNEDESFEIGREVVQQNETDSPQTFRWMKTTIVDDLYDPPRRITDTFHLTNREAARRFLSCLLEDTKDQLGRTESYCFTLPIHSFHDYQEWLTDVALECGIQTPSFIDEATAASVGYSISMAKGDRFIVVDFGGGSLDISIVEVKPKGPDNASNVAVLGIAGTPLGGRDIDRWLVKFVLQKSDVRPRDDGSDPVINDLLLNCERAKEELSFAEVATIAMFNPAQGSIRTTSLGRSEFEDLLDENNMFSKIEDCLRAALNQARSNGLDESDIKKVLLVGGSTLIPSFRRHFLRRFGADRVESGKPFTAVARGASRVASGGSVDSRIFHDYAIRYLDDEGRERFEPIISPGQEYPAERIWSREITATTKGQRKFNLEIYQRDVINGDSGDDSELVFSETGIARLFTRSKKKSTTRMVKLVSRPVFAEESSYTGQICLSAKLDIDGHRRLLANVRDIRMIPNEVLLQDSPLTYVR